MIINKRLYRNFILNRIFANTGKFNPLEVPYISNRYITPTWDINDDVILDMYTCDYYQTDFMCEPPIYQDFTLILNLDGNISYHSIKSGDLHLNIGKQSEGDHWFTVQVRDIYGRYSHELYEEFRIIDTESYNAEIEANTYTMTADDLITYGIDNTDSEENALATKQGLQRIMDDKAAAGVRKLILLQGTYQIKAETKLGNGLPDSATDDEKAVALQYEQNNLSIPNNFTLDLNGSRIRTKTTEAWQNIYRMITIDDKYDSHVINGTLEGDYRRRSNENRPDGYTSAEQGGCFSIIGDSRYCSLEDVRVELFPGYCCTMGVNGTSTKVDFSTQIQGFTNVNIDKNGNEFYEENKWTSDYYALPSKLYDSKTILVGQYLGNGWTVQGDSWNVDYHLYDENKKLIRTIHGFQYREFIKPTETRFIRCTYYCKTTDDRPDPATYLKNIHLTAIDYAKPRNCTFRNLYFYDTRTCGMNPNQGNNILIEGCKYDKCATNITPVCVDFEDGWYLMQDYMYRNNEVLVPVGNGDVVTDGGMNIMFKGNINHRIGMQGHFGVGFLFEDNKEVKIERFLRTPKLGFQYCMIRNEECSRGNISFVIPSDETFIARNFKMYESTSEDLGGKNSYYLNADIDGNNMQGAQSYSIVALPMGKYVNSTIKNYTGWDVRRTKWQKSHYKNCSISNVNCTINYTILVEDSTLSDVKITYDNCETTLTIKNSNLTNFHINYGGTWKPVLNIILDNCTIDNSNSPTSTYTFIGTYNHTNATTFKFTVKNCTFKNGTAIATDDSLNHDLIAWELNNNIFE